MEVVKKIFNTLITILIVMVLVVSIFVAIFALTSKSSGISTVFGNTIQIIQSDSMKGGYQGSENYKGGNFEKGDVIIGKATEWVNDAKYEVGDIVTYKGFLSGAEDMGEQLICHRIIAVSKDGLHYQTKGDNNEVAEIPDQDSPEEGIMASDIGATFHTKDFDGKIFKGVGNVFSFITSQMGFFLVVLLPMIIFFLYELIRVVLNIAGYKKAKQEDIKEEMRKEFEEKYANQQTVPQAVTVASDSGSAPSMSAEEFKQFQEFQEFKKMQQMYNQQNNDNSANNAENKGE